MQPHHVIPFVLQTGCALALAMPEGLYAFAQRVLRTQRLPVGEPKGGISTLS
jgi:hypothetical protein